jgi:hypothetical protein
MTLRYALVVGCCGLALSGCASMVTLRASTNDYLKPAASSVLVKGDPAQAASLVEQLFAQRGYPLGSREGSASGATFLFFRGARPPNGDLSAIGLGSFFAVRLAAVPPNLTSVSVLGKPMVGTSELCSDADGMLSETRYSCRDVQQPAEWNGKTLVTGRDEAEVVSWVVTGVYERLGK